MSFLLVCKFVCLIIASHKLHVFVFFLHPYHTVTTGKYYFTPNEDKQRHLIGYLLIIYLPFVC
jgi:hypothetical protein